MYEQNYYFECHSENHITSAWLGFGLIPLMSCHKQLLNKSNQIVLVSYTCLADVIASVAKCWCS